MSVEGRGEGWDREAGGGAIMAVGRKGSDLTWRAGVNLLRFTVLAQAAGRRVRRVGFRRAVCARREWMSLGRTTWAVATPPPHSGAVGVEPMCPPGNAKQTPRPSERNSPVTTAAAPFSAPKVEPTPSQMLEWYRQMALIRQFEVKCAQAYQQQKKPR